MWYSGYLYCKSSFNYISLNSRSGQVQILLTGCRRFSMGEELWQWYQIEIRLDAPPSSKKNNSWSSAYSTVSIPWSPQSPCKNEFLLIVIKNYEKQILKLLRISNFAWFSAFIFYFFTDIPELWMFFLKSGWGQEVSEILILFFSYGFQKHFDFVIEYSLQTLHIHTLQMRWFSLGGFIISVTIILFD